MIDINKQYSNIVKKISDNDMIIEIIGSTEDADRIGDRMFMSGVKLDNYKKNPVILANHEQGCNEKPTVIGKAIDVKVKNNQLVFTVQFAETSNAKDWYHLYANGFMNASSIGFNEIKKKPNKFGGYDYLEWELLELSLVSIPCNPNAIRHALEQGAITKSMYNIINKEEIMKKELEDIIEEEEKELNEEQEVIEESEENEVEESTEVEEEVKAEEVEEDEVVEEEKDESEEVEEEKDEEDESEEVVEEDESEVAEEPVKKDKSLDKESKVNRKIKFTKNGGNKMNKYEQFKSYCVNTKSLTGAKNSGEAVLPEGFVNDVVDRIKKDPVALRNLVHVYPTSLRTGKIPVTGTEISADWAASDSAFQEKDFTFGEISYAISDILAYTKISNDLIADTPVNLYNELLKQVTNFITKMENAAIIAGNGTNKPKGIVATSEVKSITLQGAMKADDIVALPYEIDVTWRQNGVFLVPSELMKEIRLMKDAQGQYLFVEGSVVNGAPRTLAGYPVVELANVGSKQIVFGDLSQYYLIDRQELIVEMNDSAAFTENKVVVRFGERIDGKVAVPEAFVVLNQHA